MVKMTLIPKLDLFYMFKTSYIKLEIDLKI